MLMKRSASSDPAEGHQSKCNCTVSPTLGIDKVHPTRGDTSNCRLKERDSKPRFDEFKNREKVGRFVTNIWQKAISRMPR